MSDKFNAARLGWAGRGGARLGLARQGKARIFLKAISRAGRIAFDACRKRPLYRQTDTATMPGRGAGRQSPPKLVIF
ncbi:MAG: hypothetical protein FWH15_07770 [Betaproteobacteria bacterium]|nr:hypothetical protein [Betaproteobacteria bacterium]